MSCGLPVPFSHAHLAAFYLRLIQLLFRFFFLRWPMPAPAENLYFGEFSWIIWWAEAPHPPPSEHPLKKKKRESAREK